MVRTVRRIAVALTVAGAVAAGGAVLASPAQAHKTSCDHNTHYGIPSHKGRYVVEFVRHYTDRRGRHVHVVRYRQTMFGTKSYLLPPVYGCS